MDILKRVSNESNIYLTPECIIARFVFSSRAGLWNFSRVFFRSRKNLTTPILFLNDLKCVFKPQDSQD